MSYINGFQPNAKLIRNEGSLEEKTMKQEHRDNLRKLADYVENHVTDAEFSMVNFWNECGTVGCLLGHAVFADIIPKEQLPRRDTVNKSLCTLYCYFDFSIIMFGICDEKDPDLWDFLFYSDWAFPNSESSRLDAVTRLRMVADNPNCWKRDTLVGRERATRLLRGWDNVNHCFKEKV